jgi:hypothetical protein
MMQGMVIDMDETQMHLGAGQGIFGRDSGGDFSGIQGRAALVYRACAQMVWRCTMLVDR